MTIAHIKQAARIHLIYARVSLTVPWAVMASSLLINIVIYSTMNDSSNRSTGGISSVFGTMAFINLATITQVFPFAVALSVTRWAFLAATAVLVVAESLASGVILTVLKAIEKGTGGWGVDLRFFDVPYITQHNPFLQALVYAAPLAAMCFLGICVAAVYQRWGQLGLWLTLIGVIVVGGLSVAALIFFDAMHAIGSFFTGQPAFAVLAVYPTLAAALLAAAGGRMLLRARI
jgi:hypothetical protein